MKNEDKTQVQIVVLGVRMDQDTHEKYTKMELTVNGVTRTLEVRNGAKRIYVF
jgi:hypothetical protein